MRIELPGEEASPLATAVERLRRFVSPALADLIVHGGQDALQSRRCDVTVLFLDLRGFTGFAESVEPDHVMLVLRQFHQVVGRLVSAYEGMLERFTGDGIMIYFNAPTPVPDPQRRAVSVALAVHDHVRALAGAWRRDDVGVALGAGISHGPATVGPVGFEERYDYAAIGSVTNLAARLCARAHAGETLVCERVMGAVEGAVDAEAVGRLRLRGFQHAYPVFRLRRRHASS
jgi:class 3 adenylate cyclase